ncbi:MAG: MBL fold metallo-hydrolase [Thermoplasmata archaeon]
MFLAQHRIGPYRNFTYIVADGEGGEGVVIDPSFGVGPVLEEIERRRIRVRRILVTHRHKDHWAGRAEVEAQTGALTVAHRLAPIDPAVPVDDGAVLTVGGLTIRVLHTPGHTPDSVLYLIDGHAATGDTLFVGECGRVDLPESDPDAMYTSLLTRVVALDDGLVVLPGHDYGTTPTSTIGREKRENYTLQPRTRAEFLRFLAE